MEHQTIFFLRKMMWLQISNRMGLTVQASQKIIEKHLKDYLNGKEFSVRISDCMELYLSFKMNICDD